MWAARFYLLGPGLHKKEKGSWALTLISLYASSLWKQYDQLPQVAAIWLPHCSVLDPWTVNQSKHFFSQVALVREILSRSQGKQLIYCVFYSPSYKSDFSQMQICIWQSLCQEKPQCLRLSRMSGASVIFYEARKSPQSTFALLHLASRLLNHPFYAFSTVLWYRMSSLFGELAPLAFPWALLSVSVAWPSFVF